MEHPNAHGIHKQNKLPECRVKESRKERERDIEKERMMESVAQWGWLFVQLVWARVVIMWGLLDSARSLCLPISFFCILGLLLPVQWRGHYR